MDIRIIVETTFRDATKKMRNVGEIRRPHEDAGSDNLVD
jgi:hypothetical protein